MAWMHDILDLDRQLKMSFSLGRHIVILEGAMTTCVPKGLLDVSNRRGVLSTSGSEQVTIGNNVSSAATGGKSRHAEFQGCASDSDPG
jgi:hypothetical protein